jgi:hypothetical protein
MPESALGENLGLLSQIGTGNEQEGTENMISLIRPVRHLWRERNFSRQLESTQLFWPVEGSVFQKFFQR